jgi:hypothetical protein
MTTQIFDTIRKTVGGQSVSMDFMSGYMNWTYWLEIFL